MPTAFFARFQVAQIIAGTVAQPDLGLHQFIRFRVHLALLRQQAFQRLGFRGDFLFKQGIEHHGAGAGVRAGFDLVRGAGQGAGPHDQRTRQFQAHVGGREIHGEMASG